MVEVSIILTTYNRANQLPKTVESILNQTFQRFELIICDDCSTDNTEVVCKSYAAQDNRIRYHRNTNNLRMPENLNVGIRLSKGKYVANLHDGDFYQPELIEKWKNALDQNAEAAFVFNDYENGVSTFGKNHYSIDPIKNGEGRLEVALHFFNTFTSCVWGTVMTRKIIYEKLGLFNKDFGFLSDVEMWLRITREFKFAYIPEALINLTPREENHPYRYYNWRHKYWELLIIKKAIEYFSDILPCETQKARKLYNFRLVLNFLNSLGSLIKNKQFGRVKEGLSIFKDSPFLVLMIIGKIFNLNAFPTWYSKETYWKNIRI